MPTTFGCPRCGGPIVFADDASDRTEGVCGCSVRIALGDIRQTAWHEEFERRTRDVNWAALENGEGETGSTFRAAFAHDLAGLAVIAFDVAYARSSLERRLFRRGHLMGVARAARPFLEDARDHATGEQRDMLTALLERIGTNP
jgi:hypothetical protein